MRLLMKLLDLLIPRSCELCGGAVADGRAVCASCRDAFVRECFEHCPVCGKTAEKCECGADFVSSSEPMLGGRTFFSLTFYKSEKSYGESGRVTERLIFGLKEHGRFAAFFAEEMSRGIRRLFEEAGEDPSEWIITYPPRSTEKFFKNGFDQSELTAEKLAKLLGCRAVKTMVRGSHSAEQKTLDSRLRRENAESTLVPIRRNIKSGGKYLLFDDIITSGATVESSVRILYGCGAAAVFPISIARTMPSRIFAGNKRGR